MLALQRMGARGLITRGCVRWVIVVLLKRSMHFSASTELVGAFKVIVTLGLQPLLELEGGRPSNEGTRRGAERNRDIAKT